MLSLRSSVGSLMRPLGARALALKAGPTKEELAKLRMARGLPTRTPIPGVKHVVAVASGKGGVGKSTVAVNLAVALSQHNRSVGLLDADLYGPSVPRMMQLVNATIEVNERKQMMPLRNYGVSVMSMGFLVKESDPVVWRGLMVMKALEQLLREVDWGQLDVLVIDMPPGTGDTHLTISQQIPVSGAVVVSTPQEVALGDARKGIAMFQKVNVPIFGLVQNMSMYVCPKCGDRNHIFGDGGVSATAKEMGVDLLADVPLEPALRVASDNGQPIAVSDPKSASAAVFREMAARVLAKLDASS